MVYSSAHRLCHKACLQSHCHRLLSNVPLVWEDFHLHMVKCFYAAIGSSYICHPICVFDLVLNILISGLEKLESLNLSFTTGVMDSGLRMIATITSLTSLNLDSRQITDAGLASLTSIVLSLLSVDMIDTCSRSKV